MQCVKGDNTQSLVGEVWEHLCIQVVDQSLMLENKVVSTQIRDERKSPQPYRPF